MNTSIFKQNEEKQQQINAKLKLLSQLEGRELREIPDFEITDELRKRMKKLMWFLGELNDEAIYQIVCALYNNENIENQGDFFNVCVFLRFIYEWDIYDMMLEYLSPWSSDYFYTEIKPFIIHKI